MMVFKRAMDSMKKRISTPAPASNLSAKRTSSKKSVGSAGKKPTGSAKKKITEADLYAMIQKQAYALYLKRGSCHGDDQADWYRAEQMVRTKYKIY